MKPTVLVFSGYGLNCEEETKFAFEAAGSRADIVHINDIIDGHKKINDYQILAFPGGFSYGDDTGSGNAYANKLRNHLWDEIQKFISRDTLIIGICNGFQIIVNLGLLPAVETGPGERQVALLHNRSARYSNRWVDVSVENDSPWLKNITAFSVPIAHGEGRLYAEEHVLRTIKKNRQIALRYTEGELYEYQKLPSNPNGSTENIAGITDITGKIFGLMPHPERAMFFTQLPHWTYIKEKLRREKKQIPEHGPGLHIFRNGVAYFQ